MILRFSFVAILLVLNSCQKKYDLSNPAIITYHELPELVQKLVLDYKNFTKYSIHHELVYNLDSNERFTFETKTTGPWTDYYLLKDKASGKAFKIPYGKAFPFIIQNNRLYIPVLKNIYNSKKALISTYEKYDLNP